MQTGGMTRLARALARPGLDVFLVLAGALLASPALLNGWQVDDLFQRWILLKGGAWTGIAATPWDLFSFIDGNPERNRRLIDIGIFPWWTDDALRVRFFRPLSVLTHRLDYLVWPASAPAMHLHSLAWFATAIGGAALLYRRVLGVGVAAGLAAVLFAVDDAHGLPAGWIANRNALVGFVFGIAALIAYQRGRSVQGRVSARWSPVLFALALLSSESAIACAGYLAAFAFCLDRAPLRERLCSLLPHAIVGVLWLALLRRFRYGAAGSGVYLDPLNDLGAYLAGLPQKALILLLAQWGFPPSGVWISVEPGALSSVLCGAAIFLCLVGLFLLPTLHHDPAARFFCLGMALSLLPVGATAPDDRLLLWCGLGAMGLAGAALAPFCLGATPDRGGACITRFIRGTVVVLLVLVHAVIAPLLLPVVARSFGIARPLLQEPATRLAAGTELRSQDLIIVDHPLPFFASYLIPVRELAGLALPRAVRVLAPGNGSLEISRPDTRTLVLKPERGFLSGPFDELFRSPQRRWGPGATITLTGLTIAVGEPLPDGRPASAEFRFAVPLEDASLRWCRWERGAYISFTPPPVGGSVTLTSTSPFAW